MFNKLIASGGAKSRRSWSPGAVSVSVALHLFVLAGAVYASIAAPVIEQAEEEVTFLDVEEPSAEPPAPEPPPPAPQALPPPPQGFQELIPPIDPPAIIPEIDITHPQIDIADFSGVGVAGGTAQGVEGGTPQNLAEADSSFAYEVGVLEALPSITNMNQIQNTMARLYPRMLLDAGIEGTVTVRFVIQPDGTVDPNSVKVIDTTHEPFANASIRAIEQFRFRPGRYRGENVRVLIEMPIQWQVGS
jgi:protein TonB